MNDITTNHIKRIITILVILKDAQSNWNDENGGLHRIQENAKTKSCNEKVWKACQKVWSNKRNLWHRSSLQIKYTHRWFHIFCVLIRTTGRLMPTKHIGIEEMLAMLLRICWHGIRNRVINESISRQLEKVLDSVLLGVASRPCPSRRGDNRIAPDRLAKPGTARQQLWTCRAIGTACSPGHKPGHDAYHINLLWECYVGMKLIVFLIELYWLKMLRDLYAINARLFYSQFWSCFLIFIFLICFSFHPKHCFHLILTSKVLDLA